ncbi:MAG TPA: hypothetical protein VKB88_00115 [Bryobacteraceae bacterium]|nr:hypothetical protein [Bryobacteraceae bacterium]
MRHASTLSFCFHLNASLWTILGFGEPVAHAQSGDAGLSNLADARHKIEAWRQEYNQHPAANITITQ